MSKAVPGPRAIQLRQMREAKYERLHNKPTKAAAIFGYEPDDTIVPGETMKVSHKRIKRERRTK